MAKNNKPILSVLIDEDKRTKFAELARRHSLAMGWLVNQAIDKMIEANSIDIYRDSTYTPTISTSSIDSTDIENLVSTSIDKYLLSKSIGLTRHDVVDIVNGIVAETLAKLDPLSNAAVLTVINTMSLPSHDDVNTRIKAEIEPVAESVAELETYIESQIKQVREELKKPLAIAQ